MSIGQLFYSKKETMYGYSELVRDFGKGGEKFLRYFMVVQASGGGLRYPVGYGVGEVGQF